MNIREMQETIAAIDTIFFICREKGLNIKETTGKIIEKIGMNTTKYTLAALISTKEHDRRYRRSNVTKAINHVNQNGLSTIDAFYLSSKIHPCHIDQTFTELFK